jgi:hypothetical protein
MRANIHFKASCSSYRRLASIAPLTVASCAKGDDTKGTVLEPSTRPGSVECVGEGQAVRCTISDEPDLTAEAGPASSLTADTAWLSPVPATALLISPFFFWGTSMVAMKVQT